MACSRLGGRLRDHSGSAASWAHSVPLRAPIRPSLRKEIVRMNRRLKIAALSTLLLLSTVAALSAQDEAAPAEPEKGWSFSGGIDRASRYLFRGSDLLDGEAVVVPNLRFAAGDFAVYYYGYGGDLPH